MTTLKKVALFLCASIALVATFNVATILVGTAKAETTVTSSPLRPLTDGEIAANIFMVKPWTAERVNAGGTGFLVRSPDGGAYILTNRHVCEVMDANIYYIAQGAVVYTARQIKRSSFTDLCVIQAPKELVDNRQPLRLSFRDLVPNEFVRVFGHPYLNPLTIVGGRYLNVAREPLNFQAGQLSPDHVMAIGKLDFMVHPGNSGSPVLNALGEVEGVVFAMEGDNHMGLFIPWPDVKRFLETLE